MRILTPPLPGVGVPVQLGARPVGDVPSGGIVNTSTTCLSDQATPLVAPCTSTSVPITGRRCSPSSLCDQESTSQRRTAGAAPSARRPRAAHDDRTLDASLPPDKHVSLTAVRSGRGPHAELVAARVGEEEAPTAGEVVGALGTGRPPPRPRSRSRRGRRSRAARAGRRGAAGGAQAADLAVAGGARMPAYSGP